MLVLASALAVAACADVEPAPRTGFGGTPSPALDERRLGTYEALLTHLIEQEGLPYENVIVVTRICTDADRPDGRSDCGDEFSGDEQSFLRARLETKDRMIVFVDDPEPNFEDPDWTQEFGETVIVQVGPIEETPEGFTVGASYFCGGLCGSGSTYVVEESPESFEVTGTTGPAWIA